MRPSDFVRKIEETIANLPGWAYFLAGIGVAVAAPYVKALVF